MKPRLAYACTERWRQRKDLMCKIARPGKCQLRAEDGRTEDAQELQTGI